MLPRVVVGAALVVALVAGSDRSGTAAGGWATAIAAGGTHSCAVTRAGGVECWGAGGAGQLGDGTARDRLRPAAVPGLSGVTATAAGVAHSCALTRAGGVKCWGNNGAGQLGDGTNDNDRLSPVAVIGLGSGVAAIAASGWRHSCALTRAGGVKCWGLNDNGQLGDGTTARFRSTPVDVVGLGSGVAAIVTGVYRHSCALTRAGGMKCWGLNAYGQLGDGTTANRLEPVDVTGLGSGVTAIAAGFGHSCALMRAGTVKCWGRNASGQLGDGTTTDRATPVDVSRLGGVTAIAAGGSHTCAVTTAGGVKCWGQNDAGQLGDGTTSNRLTPVDVSGLGSGVTAIAASLHTCALLRTGDVKCWGFNESGQLGDGTRSNRSTPVSVRVAAQASLAIASRSVRVTPARIATVRLRCGIQARCRGTLALTAWVDGRLVGSPTRRILLTLGSRPFSIAAGRTRAVDVRLTARAFALLVRVKRLPARARCVAPATAGAITLVAPPR